MRDVAALAGVSLKTVSRVVNRESGVSPELVARVERAAGQLAYRPNLTASNLRRSDGRTSTMGLLLEDVANPFSAALHRGVEEAARERGVAVIASSLDEDPERERELVRTLTSRRVDALVIVPTPGSHSYLVDEIRAGLAVVVVDREPSGLAVDVVVTDNFGGAAVGVAHLIDHGHRRIAFVGGYAQLTTARDREQGYVTALRDREIPIDPSLIVRDVHSAAEAEAAAIRLLSSDEPPTAIFGAQNLVTMGIVAALRRVGRSHDVALVGFDDFPMAEVLDPGVTVIAQQPLQLGATATELALTRLEDFPRTPTRVVIPTTMITRGSGEIPPTH